MIKLSVIIPLYNTKIAYFENCLKSCQENEAIEYIVIDDGSQLNYKEIIKKYPIKYYKTINGGVSKARNIGLSLSKGEYVTFLDSDDTIIVNSNILDNLDGKDIVITRNYIIKDRTTENYYKYNDSRIINSLELKQNMLILDNRTIECIEPVWAKFYRRDFLLKNSIIFNNQMKRSEDVLFNYEAYSKATAIFYCNDFSYNYRMTNTDSATRSFDQIMDVTTFKLLEEFEKLFKKLDIHDKYYPSYVFRLMVRLIRKYYVYLSKEEYYEKIDLLFNNIIVDYYLKIVNIDNLDIYKKQLYALLVEKNKIALYNYLREVCDKKLLKK